MAAVESESAASHVLRPGDVYFSLESRELMCDKESRLAKIPEAARPLYCMRKSCESIPGARFDEDAMECACPNGGVLKTSGRQAVCQTGHVNTDGRTISVGHLTAQAMGDGPVLSQKLGWAPGHRVGARIGNLPGAGFVSSDSDTRFGLLVSGWSGGHVADVRDYRELKVEAGIVSTDPRKEWLMPLVEYYYVAQDQSLEQALVPHSLVAIEAPFWAPHVAANDANANLFAGAQSALEEMRAQSTLRGSSFEYSASLSGCAAGCRLNLPLETGIEGVTAKLVKQYFLGAPYSESVQIVDSATGNSAEVVLTPGRTVSHLMVHPAAGGIRVFDFGGNAL
jgi:hypothetical protein